MKKAAAYFKGRHDFAGFRDGSQELKSTVRTIKKISVEKKGSLIEICVEGDGFLMHMVRIIAGTLLWVGQNKINVKDIPAILASKNRASAGPTARSQGLTLLRVNY
jgi:tRNA pseudouridine38-40 synthase